MQRITSGSKRAAGIYVKTRDLPDTVRAVLKELNYNRRDIEIQVSTTFSPSVVSGDGLRAFLAIVNIATGQRHIEWGSWGGPNIFNPQNPVDLDTSRRAIPPGAAIIKGSKGGSRPVYAYIITHPSSVPLLSSGDNGPELSDKERAALDIIGGLVSGYRKVYEFQRRGLGEYGATNPYIQSLAQKGLVVVTKSGIQITTEGRNMRGRRVAMDRLTDRYLKRATSGAFKPSVQIKMMYHFFGGVDGFMAKAKALESRWRLLEPILQDGISSKNAGSVMRLSSQMGRLIKDLYNLSEEARDALLSIWEFAKEMDD